jgi:NAD(P)-dependent dehydrogenase (short-subunit alcohol dehydrogenase family)
MSVQQGVFDLTGKVALVTGAGRGLGAATARALAKAGACVVVTGRSPADLTHVCTSIVEAGGAAMAKLMNINDAELVSSVMAEVREAWGSVDVLVNNAGVAHQEPAVSTSLEDWATVIDTNLRGPFICSQSFARAAGSRTPRSIINLSSIAAAAGVRGQATYCASKAGVEGLTRALAIEFAPLNIRVNALAPGYMLSDMPRMVAEDPELSERITRKIPLRRFGEVDEIGGPVVFLASHASSYMTGATLRYDGGYTAQ